MNAKNAIQDILDSCSLQFPVDTETAKFCMTQYEPVVIETITINSVISTEIRCLLRVFDKSHQIDA